MCVKLRCRMSWHLKCIKQSHYVSGPTFNSLHKYLVWWAVTRRTLKKRIPVKIERWARTWGWAFARDNTIIRAVVRLSQSKAVTWFTGPHAVRICMNLKTVLAASKHKSCMWKHSEVSHPSMLCSPTAELNQLEQTDIMEHV